MKQPNIKRLERAAKLIEKASELLDYVVDHEGYDKFRPDDAYFIIGAVRELNYEKQCIEIIARVAREEQQIPTT